MENKMSLSFFSLKYTQKIILIGSYVSSLLILQLFLWHNNVYRIENKMLILSE